MPPEAVPATVWCLNVLGFAERRSEVIYPSESAGACAHGGLPSVGKPIQPESKSTLPLASFTAMRNLYRCLLSSQTWTFAALGLLMLGGIGCGTNDIKDMQGADAATGQDTSAVAPRPAYAIALHGGAGVILREQMTPDYEREVRDVLSRALDLGEQQLKAGANAEDVVVAVVSMLEDDPHFNAGKGAVFTYEGTNELDASLMRGRDLAAGAVSGVTGVKNPIQLAQRVMSNSVHVMLSGKGAESFAAEQGFERMPASYFYTEQRFKSWQEARAEADAAPRLSENGKFGTVGCVVLDSRGHLAAGTSTGGMTLKRWGRVGDAPVIGAGTYANDRTCAVSATGHGEYFIRYAVAHDIAARMAYGGKTLAESSEEVVMDVLLKAGGEGGVIAVDAAGNISMPFNSAGMYRASAKPGQRTVAIFGDESR